MRYTQTCCLRCFLHLQAQRDFFGSHTYQRTDKEGWFHTVWDENFGSADSITTSAYNR
jgi:6-phosphogluconate dehydrogenase